MNKIWLACTIGALCIVTPLAHASGQDDAANEQQVIGDSLYAVGRQLLNQGDFSTAASEFSKVWRDYTSSEYADEARYWQAYAIFRMNEGPQQLRAALRLLETQQKKFPDSPVATETIELATRLRGYLAAGGDGSAANDVAQAVAQIDTCGANIEVRLAALSALQNMQSKQMVPVVRKLFTRRDACSEPLRERALAILSVRPISETEDVVILAANDPNENIRRRAVPLLAQSSSDRAVNALGKLLGDEYDRPIQETLLGALAYNTNPRARQLLKKFVEGDGDPALKERAIGSLIASSCGGPGNFIRMRASQPATPEEAAADREKVLRENSEYLRDLYGTVSSPGLREQIVNGIVQIGGHDNTEWLIDVALNGKESLDVRRRALFATGVLNAPSPEAPRHVDRSVCRGAVPGEAPDVSVKTLVKLYNTMDDQAVREQLLAAFARRIDDSKAMDKLIAVAKGDPVPHLRQRAIFWLSQSKEERAAKAVAEIVAP